MTIMFVALLPSFEFRLPSDDRRVRRRRVVCQIAEGFLEGVNISLVQTPRLVYTIQRIQREVLRDVEGWGQFRDRWGPSYLSSYHC